MNLGLGSRSIGLRFERAVEGTAPADATASDAALAYGPSAIPSSGWKDLARELIEGSALLRPTPFPTLPPRAGRGKCHQKSSIAPFPLRGRVGRGIEAKARRAANVVLEQIAARKLAPSLDACGEAEIGGLLSGLAGRFVAPGPSGAPSRGRPEVLPTGRNFYSVDARALPTQAAWALGWKSAQLLVARHAQEQGAYPRRMALSAWGTANMRTGGDDIAQALALMGVRPRWEPSTGRVVGFEILPAIAARSAAGRCDAAGLRLLPRRLRQSDRPRRQRHARGGGARRGGRDHPAGGARDGRPRGARREGSAGSGGRAPRRRPRVRLQARRPMAPACRR